MSRFYDDDGDGDRMSAELWQANVERAIKGKRGQKVLRELRDALLALPQPRLIEGALCTVGAAARMLEAPDNWLSHAELGAKVEEQGEGVCSLGAWLWHRQVRAGTDPAEAFASLPTLLDTQTDLYESAALARDAGMTLTLAWDLAMRNDETYGRMTPEDRCTAFLEWIDGQLAGQAVSADA